MSLFAVKLAELVLRYAYGDKNKTKYKRCFKHAEAE
ncbi:MAG: hypothetical protein ACI9TY_000105 [Alphaproteobacteria bacterium]|jgi:hypothetical protein